MKRSRAPSSVAAATNDGVGSKVNANVSANVNGSGVAVAAAPTRGRSCRAPPSCIRAGSFREEESQQSLEVDVGMEDLTNSQQGNASSGKPAAGGGGGRRRSTRSTFGCTNSGSSGGGGGGDGTQTRENTGTELCTAAAMASVEANGSGSSRGGSAGATKSRRGGGGGGRGGGGGGVGGGGMVNANKKANASHDDDSRGGGKGTEAIGVKQEERREDGGEGGEVAPPPKKKKKYIRNPETHKVYRARMESELAQARKMLEEGNAAMVDLARDYKRQQAIIERYRLEDNSLQSFSQLTQSQPTKQQQQQQQQLQQHQQHQHQQEQQQLQPLQQLQLLKPPPATPLATTPLQACRAVDGGVRDEGGDDGAVDEDGAADAKSSLDALLECSQGSATFEPEMGQLSQDACAGLSQTSTASFSLMEATQWMAGFHDSQEAWNLDGILFSQEAEQEDEAISDGGQEEDEGPDSVEAVALAAEALSPSRQGMSPVRPLPPPPSSSSSSRLSRSASISPMRPPPPHVLTPGGGGGRARGAGGVGGISPTRNTPSGSLSTAAAAAVAAATGGGGVVRVGVACLVTNPKKPGRVLIGKRKGSIGAGTLGLPGGHLEVGEEWTTCASREVLEETGLQVETPTFSWVINSPRMEGGLHYVTIFMLSAVSDPDREPRVMEPDKCEGWSWEDWKSLGARKSSRARGGGRWPGESLFHPLAILRNTSYNPFRGIL